MDWRFGDVWGGRLDGIYEILLMGRGEGGYLYTLFEMI